MENCALSVKRRFKLYANVTSVHSNRATLRPCRSRFTAAKTFTPVGWPSALCSICFTACSLTKPLSMSASATGPASGTMAAKVGASCSLSLGRVDPRGGDDEAALDFHRRLRVVSLLEGLAVARLHDPAFLVGEVDLVRRPGRPAPAVAVLSRAAFCPPPVWLRVRPACARTPRVLPPRRARARTSISARAPASLALRSARRWSSSGMDRPSSSGVASAASPFFISSGDFEVEFPHLLPRVAVAHRRVFARVGQHLRAVRWPP